MVRSGSNDWWSVWLHAGLLLPAKHLFFGRRATERRSDAFDRISKAGASFRSLGDPLWDTGSSQGRLLSTMLAAIAEFERELIRERTGEGRKRAMAAGVKFGRKRKLSDFQRAEAVKRRAAGETLASIAKSYAVDISMISRLKPNSTAGGQRQHPVCGTSTPWSRTADHSDQNCDKIAACVPGAPRRAHPEVEIPSWVIL